MLKQTPFFKDFSNNRIRTSLQSFTFTHWHKGETVITEDRENEFLYIVAKGSVKMSIGIKKPYADIDQSKTLLRQEKYNLKDRIHGIVRWTDETLEERNCVIEGDDTGLMGASPNFKQVPLDGE